MASRVTVNPDSLAKFQQLRLQKRYGFIVFKLNDAGAEIIVDKVGKQSASHDEFMDSLLANDCRYAAYDFRYLNADNTPRNKLCFVSWSPDEATIKNKMQYASSKEALKRSMPEISLEISATDVDEISLNAFKNRVR